MYCAHTINVPHSLRSGSMRGHPLHMSGKALNLVASLLQFSECRGQLKAKWQSHLKKGLSVHREIIVRLVTADAVFDADIVDHHRNHRLVSRQGSGPSRCPLAAVRFTRRRDDLTAGRIAARALTARFA
jgi:hypothetical protein